MMKPNQRIIRRGGSAKGCDIGESIPLALGAATLQCVEGDMELLNIELYLQSVRTQVLHIVPINSDIVTFGGVDREVPTHQSYPVVLYRALRTTAL